MWQGAGSLACLALTPVTPARVCSVEAYDALLARGMLPNDKTIFQVISCLVDGMYLPASLARRNAMRVSPSDRWRCALRCSGEDGRGQPAL
jgi:hypothetical protein